MIHGVRSMVFITAVALYGCGCGGTDTAKAPAVSARQVCARSTAARSPATVSFEGAVAEATNAGRYVYVRITAGSEDRWFAMPQTEVRVGDRMAFGSALLMTNFHSDILGRTFERVYFSSGPVCAPQDAQGAAGPSACPAEHKSAQGGDACCPTMPQAHSPASGEIAGAAPDQPATTRMFTGMVIETMQAGRYTYVLVASRTNQIWAATPECEMNKGDKVAVPMSMPMRDFTSPTLKRSFDVLYMVPAITRLEKAKAE